MVDQKDNHSIGIRISPQTNREVAAKLSISTHSMEAVNN